MPKVSVVMPAYNAEKYIIEAINSILQQTFTDFEFIIINDGSTDKTKELILSVSDPRIVYLENTNNCGIVKTLNKGIQAACGEYIARMDADDISAHNRLELQVQYMNAHPNVGVLGTGIQIFSEKGLQGERRYPIDSKHLKAELIFASCFAHPTVMIRKSELTEKQKLLYDERFAGREDYALWWELSQYCDFATLPHLLHKYRIHANQVTQAKKELKLENQKLFYQYRMDDFGMDFSEEEDQAVFDYCIGDIASFDYAKVRVYCEAIRKIIHRNRVSKRFAQNELRTICSLSIIKIGEQSRLDRKKMKAIYTPMLFRREFSLLLYIKSLYYDLRGGSR